MDTKIQSIDNSPYQSQLISLTNSSVATTDAINSSNGLIRIATSHTCHVAFGATPTATTSDTLLPAGSTSFFTMKSGDKVALIGLVATTGRATVTTMESIN
jgi:hypothetical protein